MTYVKLFAPLISLVLVFCSSVCAEGLRFGIIAKSVDDGNFIDVWRGCNMAAKEFGDSCVLVGPRGGSNARLQLQSIKNAAASQAFDGFAISVTSSSLLAPVVKMIELPVITFDSPFAESEKEISQAYIGIDNEEFGRDLARIARTYHPNGGTLCMMSALHDTNLALRIRGVRRELSGDPDFPDNKKLTGEGGWKESARCPWDCSDNVERAVKEMQYTLDAIQPDVFLSVGWWPIVDPSAYRKAVTLFAESLRGLKCIILVGVGKILPEFKALMDDRLVHGYVSIDFAQIGRLSYETLKAAVENDDFSRLQLIPNVTEIIKN